jgi:DNA-binding MarR family transcriptional regulator
MGASTDECACELLDVVPLIMRAIRAEMRSHRTPDLSVPQFRTLAFINHNSGATLSDAAEYIGLTLPSMSKQIDVLVNRKLVSRQTQPEDRRRLTLTLTTRGQTTLQAAREGTLAYLADLLSHLSAGERTIILQAMQTLQPLFTPGRSTQS